MFDYQSRLFQWRKGEPVIHTGRTMHFMSRDKTYGFFIYNDNEELFVFVLVVYFCSFTTILESGATTMSFWLRSYV